MSHNIICALEHPNLTPTPPVCQCQHPHTAFNAKRDRVRMTLLQASLTVNPLTVIIGIFLMHTHIAALLLLNTWLGCNVHGV